MMTRYSYIIIDPLSSFGPGDRLQGVLSVLRDCGYTGVELNLTKPTGVDLDRLEGWLSDLGLVVPSFLTGDAYREGLCLSAPDLSVRQRTVQRLIDYLDVARQFDAILVVGLLQGFRSDEPDPEVANRRITECLREVAAAAEDKKCEIVIEPVNHLQVGFNNSVGEVLALIKAVDSPAVKPMVDTIHMNIEEASLVEPIRECGARLRHVHLCESNGSLFGTGNVDFGSVLRSLDEIDHQQFASVKIYRGAALQEAAPSSIEYLRKVEV